MNEQVKKLIKSMDINPPASEKGISDVELEMGINFPDQYKEFMLESNGAEAELVKTPT